MNKLEESLKFIEKAIEIDTRDIDYINHKGFILFKLEDLVKRKNVMNILYQ